jgi:formate hydrogenlyase subunit 3/multisubunit Na+/H+ antiporter MnhD subunit
MSAQSLVLFPILLPLVLAALLPLARKSVKTIAALPLVAGLGSALAYLGLAGSVPVHIGGAWVGPFTLEFSVDVWRALLLVFIVIFEVMAGLYALSAASRFARPKLLIASLLIAFAAAPGVVLTDNVLVLLVFWEVFLVALYGAIHAGGERAERVAQKALIIGGASDFLMILGLMLYLNLGGSATFGTKLEIAGSPWALTSFILIFLGAGAKAGMFPFHTWIPEAAEVMPATGFAALPASLEKVLGISFLFTLTNQMFALTPVARTVMMVFAVATAFVVIFPALVESNLKRVLALTAISPVGFMIAGMATTEAAGMVGALMYMLTHATYKSGMFFAAGTFEEKGGSANLSDLTGIGRSLPVAGWGFVLAFVAAISLPPTGGFMAKELIFEGLLSHGHLIVLGLLAIAAVINIAVFCKVVAVLMARGRTTAVSRAPLLEVLPPITLGVLALLSGAVFSGAAAAFLSPMVSLAIYLVGFMLYLGARAKVERSAATFAGLSDSPVLGRGLQLAAEKKFDAYEIGLKVVEFITRVVFRYVERLIDVVADGVIGIGAFFSRHFLSAIHSGVYSTYLAWAVVGLIVVLSLVLG